MKPPTFMLIAGEPSGDLLGAELVRALRDEFTRLAAEPTDDVQPLRASLAPRFFGAGGPQMAGAGVELAVDMTPHAVVGLVEALKHYGTFRRILGRLRRLARERQPDAIICVDFFGFNSRFARALRRDVRRRQSLFNNWEPKIIQYVSPQVWASREGRARRLERDFDLLLTIFPFEQDWYALRAPGLRVEFVGHPILDRHGLGAIFPAAAGESLAANSTEAGQAALSAPTVVLLPGSRAGELERHVPVMRDAARLIADRHRVRFWMVLPSESLAALACKIWKQGAPPKSEASERDAAADLYLGCSVGNLGEVLPRATLALASTGTVTLECAGFGVPAVAMYKTSWSTYQLGKRLVRVGFLAMPNLLAGEAIFPEFIQAAATPENIARAALELLNDPGRRGTIRGRLRKIIASLGGPGASRRAAQAIVELVTGRGTSARAKAA